MRRSRSIKELRQRFTKQRNEVRNIKIRNRPLKPGIEVKKTPSSVPDSVIRHRRFIKNKKDKPLLIPQLSPLSINFQNFDEYTYKGPFIHIVHVIESLGLGGAQTMMSELVSSLNKYYGDYCDNIVVALNSNKTQKCMKGLYNSYGFLPFQCLYKDLKQFCLDHSINIVVHHRVCQSRCIKKCLPDHVKYILVNHTVNRLPLMSTFKLCDAYISVCKYLNNKTRWSHNIHSSRRLIILNGIENDYVQGLESPELKGLFKTGRCHVLRGGKFSENSLKFLGRDMPVHIPGFHHHLIGSLRNDKLIRNNFEGITYHGAILDRHKKMSIIKNFDVYFYETSSDEGASIAVLEALGCGVPVICRPFGGTPELIRNGVNGFMVSDRNLFKNKMIELYQNPRHLAEMKQRTLEDFNNRLHIKYTACKYMQVFEALI